LQNDLLFSPGTICGNTSQNQVAVNVTSTLPIQLLPLQAYKVNSTVLLKWSAANDQQLDHFDILHSTDGVNFGKLPTSVPPQKGNALIIGYSYTDPSPATGQNYYRIAAYDKDGSAVLSNIARVDMGQPFTSALVYPNPANNSITLEYITSKRLMVQAQVLDAKGAVVGRLQFMTVPGRNNIQYNIEALAKGAYAIQLVNDEETVITRFVKE
jgi:hypothetical protein